MYLLPMKQSFYKAMCTCIDMGVLNAKLIMSSNDKKVRVRICYHANKVFTAKSHTMHYYCHKRHMYQMPSKEAVRVSPCSYGNEVSVVTSHTMDQYCVKETVHEKEIDRLSENKVIQECPFYHGNSVSLAMAHSIDGYRHKGHVK